MSLAEQGGGAAVELFCCSGGMAEGFRRSGIEFDLAVDSDPEACDAYAQNLGRRPLQIDARELERFVQASSALRGTLDFVCADPPCTPWSRAGKRKGLANQRDMLPVTTSLLELWRPRCWLIGNVPGLDDGPNVAALQRTLGRLSAYYCIDYATLDAAAYGVPQHRVRPFWFGHPIGMPCIAWPAPTHGDCRHQLQIAGTELAPYVTVREALAHLTFAELGSPIRVKIGRTRHDHPLSELERPAGTILTGQPNNCGNVLAYGRGDNHRVGTADKPARTLMRNRHSDGALLVSDKHPINAADQPSYTVTCKGDGRGAQGACVVQWPWDRPSTTLTTRDEVAQCGRSGRRGEPQSANAIKLSERAAAILQGFPEHWNFVGTTKRARWSQIGQAMPPPLAAAVATSVAAWLRCTSSARVTERFDTKAAGRRLDTELREVSL